MAEQKRKPGRPKGSKNKEKPKKNMDNIKSVKKETPSNKRKRGRPRKEETKKVGYGTNSKLNKHMEEKKKNSKSKSQLKVVPEAEANEPILDVEAYIDVSKLRSIDDKVDQRKITFLKNYILNFGNISLSCSQTKISKKCFYGWKERDPYFLEVFEDFKDVLKDHAEMKLYQHVHAGNLDSIKFYLKTKAKERGYTEKTENETTFKNDGININVIKPDDQPDGD